jgi:O-antigen/teichoic acid export membrane protein
MLGPTVRRRLPAFADQAASSLSNVLVAILVARSFGPAAFGAFSLAMVVYQLVLGGIRSLVTEPFLSIHSPEPPSVRRRMVSDLHAVTLLISVACSLLLWFAGAAAGGISGEAMTGLALVLPLVMFQDTWRYIFIVDRPAASLTIDVIWIISLVVSLTAAPSNVSIGWYVIVWGLTGGLSGLAGLALGWGFSGWPNPRRFFKESWPTGWRFFAQFVTTSASGQVVMGGLGRIAGLPALGAAKASSVYYGLLNTLHGGVHYAIVPEGARSRNNPARLQRMQTFAAVGLALLAAVWLGIGLALPDSVGEQLFGQTWPQAHSLMVPMGLAMIFGGGVSGALIGLRSLADARRCLRSQLYVLPVQVAGPLVGAIYNGAPGFAYGTALAKAFALVVWWAMFRQALRGLGSSGDAPEPIDLSMFGPEERVWEEVAI